MKASISLATCLSSYSYCMSLISPEMGYLRKKLRTRISLMFDFLLKRDVVSELCPTWPGFLIASFFRKLRA